MRCLLRAAVAAAAVTLSLTSSPSWSQVPVRPIALTGQPAPGVPGGGLFEQIQFWGSPLADGGKVVYGGIASQAPGYTQRIWSGLPESTQSFFGIGPAPGIPGRTVFGIPSFVSGPSGATLIHGNLSGDGGEQDDEALWLASPAGAQVIAREGDPAPGLAEGIYFRQYQDDETDHATFYPLRVNPDGRIIFSAYIAGPGTWRGNNYGYWMGYPGDLKFVYRNGMDVPDHPGFPTFAALYAAPSFSNSDQFAFTALLAGSGVPVIDRRGIWAGVPGDFHLVVREGDLAPGLDGIRTITGLSNVAVNASGTLAFPAVLTTAGVNDMGIWVGKPDTLLPVAMTGGVAPGTGGTGIFEQFTAPRINDAGAIAFTATLRSSPTALPDWGLWAGQPFALALIARAGQPVPGVDNATFKDFGSVYLNEIGQVAFEANLASDVPDLNTRGIWATDPEGNLHFILRQLTDLDLGDGILRRLTSASLVGFDNTGRLAISVVFEDGVTGLVYAQVPEPAGLGLLLAGALALARSRRQPRRYNAPV